MSLTETTNLVPTWTKSDEPGEKGTDDSHLGRAKSNTRPWGIQSTPERVCRVLGTVLDTELTSEQVVEGNFLL